MAPAPPFRSNFPLHEMPTPQRKTSRLRKKYLFCHSERSEESLFDCEYKRTKEREILRFAQNDKTAGFSATCEASVKKLSLRVAPGFRRALHYKSSGPVDRAEPGGASLSNLFRSSMRVYMARLPLASRGQTSFGLSEYNSTPLSSGSRR